MQRDQPPPSRSTSSRAAIAADYDPAAPAASTPPPGSKLSFPEVPAYSPPPPLAPSPALAAPSPRQPAQSRRTLFPSPPPRSPKAKQRLIPDAAAAQEAANIAAAGLSPTEIHVFEEVDGHSTEVRVHLPAGFPGRMPAGFRMPPGRMPAGGPAAVPTPPRAGSHLSILSAEAGAASASADARGLASTHRKERLARARRANREQHELSTDWDGSTASPALSSNTRLAGAAAGAVSPSSLTSTIISQAREKLRIQNLVWGLTNRKPDSSVLHDLASRPSRALPMASSAALDRARAARSVVLDATPDLEGSLLAQPPATPPRAATPPRDATPPRTPPSAVRQVAGGPGGHGAVYAPSAIWAPEAVRPATQPAQPAQPAPREAATEDGSGEAAGGEPGRATRASDSMATASIASTPASPYVASPAVPRMRRAAAFGSSSNLQGNAFGSTDGAATSTSTAAIAATAVAAALPPLPPPPPPPPLPRTTTTPPRSSPPPKRPHTKPTKAAPGEVRSVAPSQAGAASSEAPSSSPTDAVPGAAVALPELGAPSSLPLTPARRALASPPHRRRQEPQPTEPSILGPPKEVAVTMGVPKEVAMTSSPPPPPAEAEVAGLNAQRELSESASLDLGREWQRGWSGGISGAEARAQAVQSVRQSFLSSHGRPCSAASSAYASSAYASDESAAASATASPNLAASSPVSRPRQRSLSRELMSTTPMMSMTSLAQLDGDTVWGEADDQNGLQGVTPAIEGSNARDTAAKALAALDKMGKTFAKLDALTGRKDQGAETEAKQSSPLLSSLYDTFPYTFEEDKVEAKTSSTRDTVVVPSRRRGADDAQGSDDDAEVTEAKAKAEVDREAKAKAQIEADERAWVRAQMEAGERARAEARAAEVEAANAKAWAVARATAQAEAEAEAKAAEKARTAARARLEEATRVAAEAEAEAETEAETKAAAAAAKATREVEVRAVAAVKAAKEAHLAVEVAVKPGADDAASQLAVTAASTALVAGVLVSATTKLEAAAATEPLPPTPPRVRVANSEARHPLGPPDSGGRVHLSRRFSDDCAVRGSSEPASAAAAPRVMTSQQQTQQHVGRDADGLGSSGVSDLPRCLTSDVGEASADATPAPAVQPRAHAFGATPPIDPKLATRRFSPPNELAPSLSLAELMRKFEPAHKRGATEQPVPRYALRRSDDTQSKATLTSCNTPPTRRSIPSGSGSKPGSPSVSVSSPSRGVSSPSLLSLRSKLNSPQRRDACAVRDAVQSVRTLPLQLPNQVQAAMQAASPEAAWQQSALRRPMSQAIAEANAAEARTAVEPRRRRGADDAQDSDGEAMPDSNDLEVKAKLAAAVKAKAEAEREVAAAAAKAQSGADERARAKIIRASSMAVNRQQQLNKLLALEEVEDSSACTSPSLPSAPPQWQPPPPPPPPPRRGDGVPRAQHADSSDRAPRHAPQPPPGSAAVGRARAARRVQREGSGNCSLAADAAPSRAPLLAGAPASAPDPMAAALQAALAGYAAPARTGRPSHSFGEQYLAQQDGEPSYASPASVAWLQAEAASLSTASTNSPLAAAAASPATASGRLRTLSFAKGREVLRAARSVSERGYVARDATSTPPGGVTTPQRKSGRFSTLVRSSSSSLLRSSSFSRQGWTKGTDAAPGSRSTLDPDLAI